MKKILFLIVLSQLFACSKINIFDNNSSALSSSEPIIIDEFKKIIIKDIATINIFIDTSNFLIIKSRKKQMENIKIIESEGLLSLKHSNYSWTERNNNISIDIHCTHLSEISIESPCTLNIPKPLEQKKLLISALASAELIEGEINIDLDEFVFHSYGNIFGKIIITGQSKKSNIILNGAINVDAQNCKTIKSSVTQNSIGEAKVWSTESLIINTYCSGNIFYKGNIEPIVYRHKINNQIPKSKIIKL